MARRPSLADARAAAGARTVRLSDGETAYHVHGDDGPWVVLVHGLATPSYAWVPMARALADSGYRVLRYDQLGRGLSDRPAVRYDLALYARQLRELMDALDIDAAHHVSWSMGALVSSRVALDHPDRVLRLVMIAPGFFVQPPPAVRVVSKLPLGRWIIASRALGAIRALPAEHLVQPDRHPGYGERMLEQAAFPGLAASFGSTVMNYPWNAGPEFRAVGHHPRRVLLVWGDDDPATPYRNAAKVREVFPRAELVTVPGARHAPHIDHADEAQMAVLRFLRSDARVAHAQGA